MKLFLILVFILCLGTAFANNSVMTTSLSTEVCTIDQAKTDENTLLSLCPGQDGYTVEYQVYDLRGWIVLKKKDITLDTYDLVMANGNGELPYVGDSLDWHYNEQNQLVALVFPIHATDPQDPTKENLITVWVAVQIKGAKLVVIGKSSTYQDIQALLLVLPRTNLTKDNM